MLTSRSARGGHYDTDNDYEPPNYEPPSKRRRNRTRTKPQSSISNTAAGPSSFLDHVVSSSEHRDVQYQAPVAVMRPNENADTLLVRPEPNLRTSPLGNTTQPATHTIASSSKTSTSSPTSHDLEIAGDHPLTRVDSGISCTSPNSYLTDLLRTLGPNRPGTVVLPSVELSPNWEAEGLEIGGDLPAGTDTYVVPIQHDSSWLLVIVRRNESTFVFIPSGDLHQYAALGSETSKALRSCVNGPSDEIVDTEFIELTAEHAMLHDRVDDEVAILIVALAKMHGLPCPSQLTKTIAQPVFAPLFGNTDAGIDPLFDLPLMPPRLNLPEADDDGDDDIPEALWDAMESYRSILEQINTRLQELADYRKILDVVQEICEGLPLPAEYDLETAKGVLHALASLSNASQKAEEFKAELEDQLRNQEMVSNVHKSLSICQTSSKAVRAEKRVVRAQLEDLIKGTEQMRVEIKERRQTAIDAWWDTGKDRLAMFRLWSDLPPE